MCYKSAQVYSARVVGVAMYVGLTGFTNLHVLAN